MRLSDSNLALIRTRPQSTKLFLSVFTPREIFRAKINDAGIAKGDRTIAYDTVTIGSFSAVEAGMMITFGSQARQKNGGVSRVKSISASEIEIAENSDINFANNQSISIYRFFPVLPVYPRIINDPDNEENVIFFKDYDIPYTNQNTILGSYISMGSHRAAFIEDGQAQIWYTSSGTFSLTTGTVLSYNWAFEGGSPSGSNSANPGYVSYTTPGDYVTRLIVSGSNGSVDKSYRYVSIYNPISSGTNLPYLQWSLDSMEGSRDEGGYTASVTIFESSEEIEEGSVVVIFSEDYYGGTKISLGGNGENNSKIFFVGYVMDGSIKYDYEKSTVKFDIGSITRYMKEMDGFSVSVESHPTPDTWYRLLDLDITRAVYHYLRWHSTVLSTVDIEYVVNIASNNPKIQYFDADRSSLFDAVDNFMRSTIVGKTVSDRQGKIWLEKDITIYPTGTFTSIMNINNGDDGGVPDWMESPSIDELTMPPLSYLEMGGIYFSGIFTGTFAARMACAPGQAPNYRGGTERTQGLAITGQAQLSQIVRNLFAFKNYIYQSIDMPLAGSYRNLDIAPQEPVNIIINPQDTVRRANVRGDFNLNNISWQYTPEDSILLPTVTFKPIVNGNDVEVIPIPETPDPGGFNTPPIQVPNIPNMTFPANAGGIFGVQDFIHVALASNSTDFTYPIDFDTLVSTKGNLIWPGGNKIYGLSAGGIYIFSVTWGMNVRSGVDGQIAISFAIRRLTGSLLGTIVIQDYTYSAGSTHPKALSRTQQLRTAFPFYIEIATVDSLTTAVNHAGSIQISRVGNF